MNEYAQYGAMTHRKGTSEFVDQKLARSMATSRPNTDGKLFVIVYFHTHKGCS